MACETHSSWVESFQTSIVYYMKEQQPERLTNVIQNPRCTNPNQCTELSLLSSLCTSHQNPQSVVTYDQIATPVAATRVTGAHLTPEIQPDWNQNWRCPHAVCFSGECQQIKSSWADYILYLPLHSRCLITPCSSQSLLRTWLSYSLSREASITSPCSWIASEYQKCYRRWLQVVLGI